MPYGVAHSFDIPVVSSTPGPDWATKINTIITAIQTTLDAKVTPSGFNIDADLDFNDSYGAKDAKYLGLVSQSAALSGASNAHKLHAVGDELYYTDGDGTAVKLTNNGAINAASVAGISGDYGGGGVDADVSYSNSTKVYTFTQASAHAAKVNVGPLQIREDTASVTSFVEVKSPASLAASYSFFLPTALPSAAAEVMTLNSSGQVATTATPAVTSITADNASTFKSGLKVKQAGAGSTTLDHFEESTFTPQVYINNNELTTFAGASYTTQTGQYQRIGSWVTLYVHVVYTSPTAAQTGEEIQIKNLPYSGDTGEVYAGSVWEFQTSVTVDTTVCAVGEDAPSQEDAINFYRSMDTLRSNNWNLASATSYEIRCMVRYKVA